MIDVVIEPDQRAFRVEIRQVSAHPVALVVVDPLGSIQQLAMIDITGNNPRRRTGLPQQPGRMPLIAAAFQNEFGRQQPRGEIEAERIVDQPAALVVGNGAISIERKKVGHKGGKPGLQPAARAGVGVRASVGVGVGAGQHPRRRQEALHQFGFQPLLNGRGQVPAAIFTRRQGASPLGRLFGAARQNFNPRSLRGPLDRLLS